VNNQLNFQEMNTLQTNFHGAASLKVEMESVLCCRTCLAAASFGAQGERTGAKGASRSLKRCNLPRAHSKEKTIAASLFWREKEAIRGDNTRKFCSCIISAIVRSVA
jgi:hypothetical protein